MKQTRNGFTLIELIVVIAIMGLFATILIVNFNSTKGRRNLKIAVNELVSTVRKTQSYTLSAHDVRPNVPAKYYYLQFDTSASTNSYQIWAIDNAYTSPPTLVETIKFPTGIVYQATTGLRLEQPVKQPQDLATLSSPQCLQVLYALPFGKIFMYSKTTGPCDGSALVNLVKDPVAFAAYANSKATITLKDSQSATTQYMTINGVSNAIAPQ